MPCGDGLGLMIHICSRLLLGLPETFRCSAENFDSLPYVDGLYKIPSGFSVCCLWPGWVNNWCCFAYTFMWFLILVVYSHDLYCNTASWHTALNYLSYLCVCPNSIQYVNYVWVVRVSDGLFCMHHYNRDRTCHCSQSIAGLLHLLDGFSLPLCG